VPAQIETLTARDGTLCGVAVDPLDEPGLVAAIRSVLQSEEASSRLSALARKVSAENSFEQMLSAYLSVMGLATDHDIAGDRSVKLAT
jgi:hypothetical protein